MKIFALVVAAALLATSGAACTPAARTRPEVVPTGPAEVDLQTVASHAHQFDEELAHRTAGSQQEEVAAVYILGHLQQAGYVARLDAVPVADLVRSTNVIAVPPSGGDPRVVVAVAYDVGEDGDDGGEEVGLFLELARAMRVADEDHSVEFVALGAQHATISGGHLGVRRLAQLLHEEGQEPFVVVIGRTANGAPFHADGPGEELFSFESAPTNPPRKTVPSDPSSVAAVRVLTEAGLDAAVVGGDAKDIGRAVLGFLLEQDD